MLERGAIQDDVRRQVEIQVALIDVGRSMGMAAKPQSLAALGRLDGCPRIAALKVALAKKGRRDGEEALAVRSEQLRVELGFELELELAAAAAQLDHPPRQARHDARAAVVVQMRVERRVVARNKKVDRDERRWWRELVPKGRKDLSTEIKREIRMAGVCVCVCVFPASTRTCSLPR